MHSLARLPLGSWSANRCVALCTGGGTASIRPAISTQRRSETTSSVPPTAVPSSSSAGGGPSPSPEPSSPQKQRREPKQYYNFKTLHLFPSGPSGVNGPPSSGVGRRTRHLAFSHSNTEDHLPLENTAVVDDSDPYKDIRIFRRDMVDSHSGKHFSLSVDVSMKRFIDMFCDFEAKRCKLCNETIMQWHSHQGAIPHAGREGVLLELVRAYCGTPEEIVKMWWYRLHHSKNFRRIPALSHDNSHIRKRRLQFLLRFLKDREIIKDTFNVMQSSAAGAGRTWEFERLEWVGDNVVKYMFNNRLNCVFPVKEGGIRGKLGYAQFMIDGNDGLARSYDYLELQQLTQSDRVVSKFKSDVVETLFGELQLYLWSTEVDAGTEYYDMPFTKDMYTVRTLVAHVMEELGHVMFMYHAEYLLGVLQRVVRENQLQFVRADPAMRPGSGSHGGSDLSSGDLAAAMYAKKAPGTGAKLSPTKVTHGHHGGSGSALFMESTNYDKFKRVVPLGGLLPRRFTMEELSVTPTFMPHLQVAEELTTAVRVAGIDDAVLAKRVDAPSAATLPPPSEESPAQNNIRTEFYRLSDAPVPHRQGGHRITTAAKLSVPELKDEDLIPELL